MSTTFQLERTQSWKSDRSLTDIEERHKHTVRLAKGMAAHNMKELPEDFQLGEHDVICGRGRRVFNHIGNVRFRKMVADALERYSDAASKLEKTFIICDIVNEVRGNSPQGGFVKKDPMTGRYFEVGDFLAREKTSQAFRDALHDQYKSSNSTKKKRRMVQQAEKLHRQNSTHSLGTSVRSSESSTPSTNFGNNNDPCGDQSDHSIASLQNVHNYNVDDYAVNNSKFMRVDPTNNNMNGDSSQNSNNNADLLLGEYIEMPNNNPVDRRRMFATQKSAALVIDCPTTEPVTDNNNEQDAPWFNRSCPNLMTNNSSNNNNRHNFNNGNYNNGMMNNMMNSSMNNSMRMESLLSQLPEEEDEEPLDAYLEPNPVIQNDCFHHSQPNFDFHNSQPNFSSWTDTMMMLSVEEEEAQQSQQQQQQQSHQHQQQSQQQGCNRRNMTLGRMMLGRKAHSVRHINVGVGSRGFDMSYDSPPKVKPQPMSFGTNATEELVLSPIGDGSPDDLFQKLQGIAEGSERNGEDIFEPIPL